MASLDTSGSEVGGGGHKQGRGVKKAKKLSTRVDMTPMVDLGFLLITFFIFTATMSSPAAMRLNVPKDTDKEEEKNKAKESGALTIMLGKDNQVYYYEGQLAPDGSNFTSENFKGIRKVIMDKKNAVMAAHQHDELCPELQQKYGPDGCRDRDMVVVIKPNEEATFENIVNIVDEMTIAEVRRFALIDITPQENELVLATQGGAAKQNN